MSIENTLGGKKVNWTPAKHHPKPAYDRCNKGHPLQEVYDERYNEFRWDCPICIARMKRTNEDEEIEDTVRDEDVVIFRGKKVRDFGRPIDGEY